MNWYTNSYYDPQLFQEVPFSISASMNFGFKDDNNRWRSISAEKFISLEDFSTSLDLFFTSDTIFTFSSYNPATSEPTSIDITIKANDGNNATVPIPAALWLFSTGLFALFKLTKRQSTF